MAPVPTSCPLIIGPSTGPEAPYPLKMEGKVIKGFGRGSKQLGIPTANLPIDENSTPWIADIESGVYFGCIPTPAPVTSEPTGDLVRHDHDHDHDHDHGLRVQRIPNGDVDRLHDFGADFYGAEMRLLITGFIREEKDYDDVHELIEDIHLDCEVARRSLDREAWALQETGKVRDNRRDGCTYRTLPQFAELGMHTHPSKCKPDEGPGRSTSTTAHRLPLNQLHPPKERNNMQSSSLEALSDQQLYDLILNRKAESAMKIPVPSCLQGFAAPTTWMITQDTVLKRTSSPTEAFIMDYVASHTTIPIPKCHRVFPHETLPHMRYLVMDYIEGDRLDVLWPSMSWWEKMRVLWTLHGYMRQLHSVPLLNPGVPGPFDASGKSYLCRGIHFTEDGAGPFTDYSDMAAWFDRKRYQVLARVHANGLPLRGGDYPKFDTSYPLVLCHMDLGMRNVLVDKGGKLWLIDWEMAGAYPAWMEYAQCASWEHAFMNELRPPKDWLRAAKYIIGDYRWHLDSYLTPLAFGLRSLNNIDLYPSDYFEKLGLDVESL